MTKEQIREIAEANNLPTAQKKDSQEICFIPDNDYASYLEQRGFLSDVGNFIDCNGNVLGRHKGIINYTIGQRKGLGMGFGKPMYVTAINSVDNTVALGDNDDLFSHGLVAHSLCFISESNKPKGTFKVQVKIRYRAALCCAQVTIDDNGTMKILFEQPQRAVTPGQSVVLYDGDKVLGGGIIEYALAN